MRLLTTFFLLFVAGWMTAQDQPLPSGQIEVIKDFEVRLTEAKKIRIVPQPISLDSTSRRYTYTLVAPSPKIEYLVPEIKPLAIEPEKKPTYYPLMAKAGYGSPNSLLAAFSYDHVQNDAFSWGVDLGYLNGNNKKIPLQKFSDGRGRLNASYLLNDKAKIEGYIDGHFDKHYFYGAEDIPSNEEALKRSFKRYDGQVKISSLYTKGSRFNYMALLNILADKDDLGSRETGMRVGGEIGTTIGAKQFPVGIGVMADVSKYKHSEEFPLNNVLVTPFLEYFLGDVKLHLGGKALLKPDENEFLPDIELSYGLFDDLMRIKAGWKGAVHKNNFHYLSLYNPYINTRLDSINNMVSRRIYAGLNGSSGSLTYEVTAGYTKFERVAFFLQNEEDPEQFDPIYDNGHYIGFEGSLQLDVLKNVTLRTNISNRVYSLDNEAKPWHVPSFDWDGMVTYTGGSDEYHVSLIFHSENGLPYRTPGGTESRLDPLIDLNLHGDYFFTDQFGAFVEVNNILGNNRERWANYPSFGFNAKGGVIFRLSE